MICIHVELLRWVQFQWMQIEWIIVYSRLRALWNIAWGTYFDYMIISNQSKQLAKIFKTIHTATYGIIESPNSSKLGTFQYSLSFLSIHMYVVILTPPPLPNTQYMFCLGIYNVGSMPNIKPTIIDFRRTLCSNVTVTNTPMNRQTVHIICARFPNETQPTGVKTDTSTSSVDTERKSFWYRCHNYYATYMLLSINTNILRAWVCVCGSITLFPRTCAWAFCVCSIASSRMRWWWSCCCWWCLVCDNVDEPPPSFGCLFFTRYSTVANDHNGLPLCLPPSSDLGGSSFVGSRRRMEFVYDT